VYKTIVLSAVLYGCKTSSVTIRKEHTYKVVESRVLRIIFAPRRDEII
jgi:hypothetical protein